MFQRLTLMFVMCVVFLGQPQAAAKDETWILVDTEGQALRVMVGNKEREVFPGISLGRGGAADLRFQGDGRTPKGSFRVAWVNQKSKFHLFFGLDYPNIDHAELAYKTAKIDFDTYYEISRALMHGQTPPQDTALGGYIGIHGLGKRDMRVHKAANWTDGCIALTDAQIEKLARWVSVGTRVVII